MPISAGPRTSTRSPPYLLPSTPHHPHQALETIFVEEAFGDFNEKSFMDAACHAQSGPSGGVGGGGHTSASAPPGAILLGRSSRGGLRGALRGASHSGATPAISPRSPRDLCDLRAGAHLSRACLSRACLSRAAPSRAAPSRPLTVAPHPQWPRASLADGAAFAHAGRQL